MYLFSFINFQSLLLQAIDKIYFYDLYSIQLYLYIKMLNEHIL